MRRGIVAALLLAGLIFAAPTQRSEAPEIVPVPPAIRTEGLRVPDPTPEPSKTPTPKAERELKPLKPIPVRTVWREDIPLRAELQELILDECEAAGIDPLIIVGLVETESGFREDAVSPTGDYGLCQLNYRYFDPAMSPEENLRAGIELLALHLERYGSIEAALTAYNRGHDDGTRSYASVVLGKARGWGYQS